jgi:adenosylmethionine-8-amino-7-oxononanoate aminotransferase
MAVTTPVFDVDEVKEQATNHFWPHGRLTGDLSPESGIKVVDKGTGVWVYDVEGNKWFDTLSALWLVNIGHGRTEIADAVYEQMKAISFTPHDTVSPVTARLSAKLAELSNDPGVRTYFVSSGSEANETALKMAKNFHYLNGEPLRSKVISRRGSYHGSTLACTSLGRGGATGESMPVAFGPPVPGNIHVAQPDLYRCEYCAPSGTCNMACAKDIERAILHEGPETVAAFIGEPVSCGAGVHLPHPDYWPLVREICDRHGVLMIVDEVITGFGRTGKVFATEHWGVSPDIRTVAKALTGGYLPIGAAIASGKLAGAFTASGGAAFQHLSTFGGNPPACAAALANLDILLGEGLVENSANMGNYLYEQLQTLASHEIVGDVRGGLGLLGAIEIVKDRATKERFPKSANLGAVATRLMRKHGMLGRASNVIPIAPPLCATKSDIDYAVGQLDKVLTDLPAEL